MKRLITISLGIITSLIAFGQAKSLDFTFGKFDSISVDNGFEVTIMKGSDNKANILRIMELRIEKAHLLGFESPAAMILDDKMAHDPATVDEFLSGIMSAAVDGILSAEALINQYAETE